jgi:LysM repeat protein
MMRWLAAMKAKGVLGQGGKGMLRLRLCLISSLVAAMLLGTAPVVAASPNIGQTQDQIIHVVQPGENLFRIGLHYDTTVDAIIAANGLPNQTIYAGQRLVIPRGSGSSAQAASPAATGSTYIVQRGDTLSSIALRHGVTIWELMQANGLASSQVIYAGQRLVIPGGGRAMPASAPAPATSHTYVVRRGDSLSRIAQRFGTTVTALARLNGIANPSAIYAGQVLRVSGAAPAPSGGGGKHIVTICRSNIFTPMREVSWSTPL